MSRAPQLRSGRVLCFGPASLGTLMGSVAEKLEDLMIMQWFTRVDGPVNGDFPLVWRTLNACLNVETMATPANGGRIYVPAVGPDGLKLIGCRERAW